MARKNNLKSENAGSIQFNTQTKAVIAGETQDHGIKEKVSAVREVVPGKSNNEIVLVLQYYDYDVEKAIQAYFEDGAKAALTEWHFSGNKVSNKKKKNKKGKTAGSAQTADGAAGLSSNQRVQVDANSNLTKEPLINGDILNDISRDVIPIHKDQEDRLSMSTPVSRSAEVRLDTPQPTHQKTATPSEQHQPQRNNHRHEKHLGFHGHSHNEHGRQRTSSERSTSSISTKDSKPKKPFAGLERSTKDLHRQTTSLERLRLTLQSEFDKAYKRMQTVFEEAHSVLKQREVDLIREMDNVKANANLVFSQRQEKGFSLKTRIERAERFNESELAELRADIKLFVSDRKVDEDLGRTTRFMYDSDHLFNVIRTFAEVVPVNCAYSARRPSLSSVGSSALSPEDAPASPTFHKVTNSLDITPHIESNEVSQDSLSTEEMAELQHRLKNSLKLQGVPVKSPPPRNRPISAPGQSKNQSVDFRQNKNSRQKPEQQQKDDKTSESAPGETTQQEATVSSDRLNSGSRSPRRNYAGGQPSPQRYNADGRPRSDRGQRGRGEGYRGRGGEGSRWRDDGRGRGRDRRGRGRGEYAGRGGRGMSRGGVSVQSSQISASSSATTLRPTSSTAAATATATVVTNHEGSGN